MKLDKLIEQEYTGTGKTVSRPQKGNKIAKRLQPESKEPLTKEQLKRQAEALKRAMTGGDDV